MLKKMNLETNAELLSSSVVSDDGGNLSSFLNLTPGPDDSAEISTIVNTICLRKKKSGRNHEKRFETETSLPKNFTGKKEEPRVVEKIQLIPETPHLNFSLNFSLGKLLEADDTFQGKLTPSQDLTSTPLKPTALMHNKNENWDSFSTPPPLAARFSKLHL